MMRIAFLIVAVGFLLACSTRTNDSEGSGEVGAPIPYFGPSSLEERIASHSVVIRGHLDRTTSEVIAASGEWEGQYAVVIKFHLTVSEYLRGSGATNVIAVWGSSYPHATEAEAEATRPKLVKARPTTWDNQEAVFFLHDETYDLFTALEGPGVYFLGYGDDFDHDDGFSINSRFDRLWLPAADDGGVSGASGDDNRRFRLGPPPFPAPSSGGGGVTGASEVEDPTVTIARLKELIALVEADIARGDGSDQYETCIRSKYRILSWDAYLKLAPDRERFYELNSLAQSSGLAPSTVLFSQGGLVYADTPTRKSKLTLDGSDANLFTVTETAPQTLLAEHGIDRFEFQVRATRPLPAGRYSFHSHYTPHIPANCTDHPLLSFEINATFTNANAVHEAFFDPVTVGSAVAADSSNGVLKPMTFTDAKGGTATIHSISYEAGTVKVKNVPWSSLSGHVLDFIELDGTASLSLNVSNSSVEVAKDTLTWSVSAQPWEDGDKLMVRIRRIARIAPFAPAPASLTSTASGDDSISLSWDSVTRASGYVVERRESGEETWEIVDAKVTGTTYTVSGLLCATTYEFRVGAYGDGTRYERVTGPGGCATASEPTDACSELPVFDAASYSFSIIEGASVGSTVGAVSATDPNEGDTVVYSITTAGNEAGKFAIDGSTGRITLAGALDYQTAASHTLTVEASDGNGRKGTVGVTVSVEQAWGSNGTAVASPSDNAGLVADCLTLLALRDSLEGTVVLNWGSDVAIGKWKGVGVTGTPGRVHSLSLSDLGLNGTVPAGLGELAHLRSLDLSENELTGGIPSSLRSLSGLELLELSENDLTGAIPTELGDLTGLGRLSLGQNRLTGSIPPSLGRLSNLYSMAVADNDLSGSIPVTLGSLSRLLYLSLGGNDLSGMVPSELGSLASLQYLYLDTNDLTGGIPSELGSLSKLEILSLYGNKLTGGIPSELGNLSKLEELMLSRNGLTGSIPTSLERLSKLVYLRLSGNRLTGCIPAGLRNVADHDLGSLGLAYCASEA
ncbi:MAG: cadherin domain-containing protein [Chloroflexi bacterium]|nr:cadherin domain-containing protein [Chloroflexota bacterium]